jgi:hypothetical protein
MLIVNIIVTKQDSWQGATDIFPEIGSTVKRSDPVISYRIPSLPKSPPSRSVAVIVITSVPTFEIKNEK